MKSFVKLFFVVSLILVPFVSVAQTWQYTGALSEPKRTGVLTTLPNQTAIYVGGADANGFPLTTCEIYNPATTSWTLAAPLAVGVERHTVTQLADGRLVVIGGNTSMDYDESQPTGAIEIYDYTTNTWSNGGTLSIARQNHSSTLLLDGNILVAGGYTGGDVTSSVEIYDPSTQTCRSVAPLILARHDHSAILLNDGRVLVVGGRDGGSSSNYFNECEIYDPTSDTWTVIGNMIQARIKGSLATFSDGTVLASGGRNTPNTSAPGSEVLTGTFSLWNATSPMLVPMTWNGSALLPQDRFLVTGGLVDADWTNSFTGDMTPTCEWYDKPNERWFFAPQLNLQRSYHGQCYMHQTVNDTLPQDMVLVAAGITGDYTFTQTAEILDVTDHALQAYKEMPQNLATVNSPSNLLDASVVMQSPGQALLQLSLGANSDVRVDIISSAGETLSTTEEELSSGSYALPLIVSNNVSGIYFARVNVGGVNTLLKFAILK